MISQKASILCILEILQKYSDEDHRISAEKIREKLNVIYGIDMERRTIYRNIDALRSMGYDIQGYTDNREGYCLLERTFEMSEIRLLCDAVAASDMIKPDTSKNLISRLAGMLSIFQGRMLQKTVYVKDSNETKNNQIFYNIDTFNVAINQGCKVCFKEIQYGPSMHLEIFSDRPVIFNPYATIWAAGNYYVIGKHEYEDNLTHYRLDRLHDIELLEHTVEMFFGGVNPRQYAERFILNKGENICTYELTCEKKISRELSEHFGDNVTRLGYGHDDLHVKIKCIPSEMKEWALSHCDTCEVLSPQSFREEIQSVLMTGYKKYWH